MQSLILVKSALPAVFAGGHVKMPVEGRIESCKRIEVAFLGNLLDVQSGIQQIGCVHHSALHNIICRCAMQILRKHAVQMHA